MAVSAMTTTDKQMDGLPFAQVSPTRKRFNDGFGFWLLLLPALIFFIAFFVVPTASLFALASNKSVAVAIPLSSAITFDNSVRIFTRAIH